MPPTITEAHPPLPLSTLTNLINTFDARSLSEKKAAIELLVDVHPTVNVEWAGDWRYRRARRLKPGQRPEVVDELIWNRSAPAQLGRANPAGFQVLYLADRQDTALREARVEDDPAVVAEFRIKHGHSVRVAPIGEFIRIHRTGRGPFAGDVSSTVTNMLNACARDEARSLLITDAFLLHCLSGDDYEVSSHLALSVLNKLPTVTAVAYPSMQLDGAMNFAVRVELFWESWAVWSVRYGRAKHLAMGFYKFSDTAGVSGICDTGELCWKAVDNPEVTLLLDPPYSPPVT